jgi:arabinofuranan 3-O-arabinosyltransferase
VGDGQALPLRSGFADVIHCSNVLEHVVSPTRLIEEMVRSLRVGGIGYLAFTPWLSPWGGHETSPWHYLGGDFAARLYARRHGAEPKNRYGTGLFALRLGPVRRQLDDHAGIEVLWQGPRYWPASWHGLSRVPLVGEALSWNHLTLFRRVR